MTQPKQHEAGAIPQYLREPPAAAVAVLSPENRIVDAAIARMNPELPDADAVLQKKMVVVLRHLHAMVDELALQEHELLAVLDFINSAAKSNDVMVIADLLGVSMRVNDLTYRTPKGTAPNVIGPLYREEAPFMDNPGAMVSDDEPGEHIWMLGQVIDADTRQPLAGTVFDFWQTNSTGKYENEDASQPDYNFRRRIKADSDGRYRFRTIIPGAYPVANRGAAAYGLMLRLGRGVFRAPHLHVMISQPGYRPLTSMVYFEGSPLNAEDCIFSCRPENMAGLRPSAQAGELKECQFDVAMTREPAGVGP